MQFIIVLSALLVLTAAEILEPTAQNLEKESPSSLPQEDVNNIPAEVRPDTLEEQPTVPLIPAPAELQDKKIRQQRNILIRSEIPTLLVPTYEIPQFYILADQARYAPWYYYPVVPVKEKQEPTIKQ